jgi:hypothetical protein
MTSDFLWLLPTSVCLLSDAVFSSILSYLIFCRKHGVEKLISLLSWWLRPLLLSNQSSVVDLVTLPMCSAKPCPQMVRLQLSGGMSQFYMQAASIWRYALINISDSTGKGSSWKKIIVIMYPNGVTCRMTIFNINPRNQGSPIIFGKNFFLRNLQKKVVTWI